MIIGKGAGVILINDDKRILLQHRDEKNRWNQDVWSEFGGQIKKGETPEIAVKRELFLIANEKATYGLNEWFLIKTNGNVICVSLAALDKRRLSKVLNSTQSITKDEFRKLSRIFMRISAYEGGLDKPIPVGVVYLNFSTCCFLDLIDLLDFILLFSPFAVMFLYISPSKVSSVKRTSYLSFKYISASGVLLL